MDLSTVLKSKYLLYGAGGLGTTAVGAIGVKAAVGGYSPTTNPLSGFEKIFRTDKIGTDVNRNIFDIRAGECFSRFFPGVKYPSPTSFAASTGTIPSSSKIDLSKNPIGCGMIKYSHDKNKKRYVYRSEFTVKNEQYGFSLFTGATNLKEKGKNYLEFWFTILKKEGSSWKILENRKWSRSSPNSGGDSHKHFKTKNYLGETPDELIIDMRNASDADLEPSTYSPHTTKHISGFWLTGMNGHSENKKDMFEEGSTEKWGLKEHLGKVTSTTVQSTFLQDSRLNDKKGRWVTQESHCKWVIENDKQNPNSTTESNRHLCYNGWE